MSFIYKAVCFAAPALVFCVSSPVLAAPPQFAGKISARRGEFNDFIRRNANQDISLSVVFDAVTGKVDRKRVEEPNDVGNPHPKTPSFYVDDHWYSLESVGNTEEWKKRTGYDSVNRQLKGTFRVTFKETFKNYAGVKSYLYELRYLPLSAASGAGQAADAFRVVPGERIGRVALGDSREAVHRRLGTPAGPAYPIDDTFVAEAWPATGKGATRGLLVLYRNDKVVQIEATTTAFRTSGGLTFASSSEAWTRAYGRRESVILYKFPGNGKRPVGYEDWTQKGFAYKYEFLPPPPNADLNEDSPIKMVSLIVHSPGTRVIPDKNAQWNGGGSPPS